MYLDGIRNSTSQNREMFAIEQVEVTKGSASAMGGAGTVGGSINMISKVAKKVTFRRYCCWRYRCLRTCDA